MKKNKQAQKDKLKVCKGDIESFKSCSSKSLKYNDSLTQDNQNKIEITEK